MAYNDSGELPASQSTYSLGNYTFELKVQNAHEPGEGEAVSVFAICRGPDGNRETQVIDFPSDAEITSWYVEANETEASVYAHVVVNNFDIVEPFIPSDLTIGTTYGDRKLVAMSGSSDLIKTAYTPSFNTINASLTPVEPRMYNMVSHGYGMSYTAKTEFTYKDKTVYWGSSSSTFEYWNSFGSGQESARQTLPNEMMAWFMFYGAEEREESDELIGRFAIDIREADPESWDEPGDDGPPNTTLNVTVTGASAGNCTGTPSDNWTVKGYGDGGDGGYGGGGGAGASTVIIYEFATDKAESVNQTAISRGPGSGGPGGKGGRGGDGCILIFY